MSTITLYNDKINGVRSPLDDIIKSAKRIRKKAKIMAVTEKDVVDSVAYENDLLLLQLYDHLDFDGEFEKDHMMMLQDKLNTYIWYIDSKQYRETYPEKEFNNYLIKIFFVFEPSVLCRDFIIHVNKRLSNTKIKIEYIVENDVEYR